MSAYCSFSKLAGFVLCLLQVFDAQMAAVPEHKCTAESQWQLNSTHDATAAFHCSVPVIDAQEMSLGKIAARLAKSNTPVLIRGLASVKQPWREALAVLGSRSKLIERFGGLDVRLGIGVYLAQGPETENAKLNAEKLEFVRNTSAPQGKKVPLETKREIIISGDTAT